MRRLLPGLLIVTTLSVLAAAQQPNTSLAALSINGTGKVDAMGNVIATDSQISPTPPGSAPTYHHRTGAKVPLEFRVQGNPGMPYLLVTGPIGTGVPIGADTFELNPAGSTILLNGQSPTNIFDLGAVIGANGSSTVVLTSGAPTGFPNSNYQAIIFDPTAGGVGLRVTASVTLEVANTIPAITNNFTDGIMQSIDNPSYLAGCLAANFLHDGSGPVPFVNQFPPELVGGPFSEQLLDTTVIGIGPNSTVAPAIATGAPATGQTETVYWEIQESFVDPFAVASVPSVLTERLYDVQMVEEAGVWKVAGNQRDAEIYLELFMTPGASNPQGVDVWLQAEAIVFDGPYNLHGGVASVDLTGPQLANVNMANQATSSASGTFFMPMSAGLDCDGAECYDVAIQLNSSGTSRFPLVEDGTGPRDTYDVTINWNDGSTSGPYTMVLRSSVDVDANPAAALAAIPGQNTLTTTLTNPGGANASLAVTFDAGTVPAGLHSHFDINVCDNMFFNCYQFFELSMSATGTNSVTLGVPFLNAGPAGDFSIDRGDVFSTCFRGTYSPNL